MDVAPLVSALRYRFHVLDAYGTRLGGLARPAATIEEALRVAAAELKLAEDPQAELRQRAGAINTETRSALRDAIARAENDLAIAISRYGTDIGAPAVGAHIDMRTTLDGLDRSYRTMDPETDNFDGWYDQLDAQIGHLASLAVLERELDVAKNGQKSVRLPDSSPGRLKWLLAALVAAALVALGIAVITTLNLSNPSSTATPLPEPGPEAPRVVRTVPIIVTAPAPEAGPSPSCRNLELEIVAEGASLVDAPLGGRPVVQLEAGEKVLVKQVIELTGGRMIEVEAPGRSARGFIGEREARLPVMTWTCDR